EVHAAADHRATARVVRARIATPPVVLHRAVERPGEAGAAGLGDLRVGVVDDAIEARGGFQREARFRFQIEPVGVVDHGVAGELDLRTAGTKAYLTGSEVRTGTICLVLTVDSVAGERCRERRYWRRIRQLAIFLDLTLSCRARLSDVEGCRRRSSRRMTVTCGQRRGGGRYAGIAEGGQGNIDVGYGVVLNGDCLIRHEDPNTVATNGTIRDR